MRQHLILDVTFAGRTLRVADDALDIADSATGAELSYSSGLSAAAVSMALEFLGDADSVSVPVECILPVDLAAERARGHLLQGSPAELSIWTEGTDYSAREILVSATVSEAEFGEAGESIAFSIEATILETTALVPGPTLLVDSTTWTPLNPRATVDLIMPYPIIFGMPGVGAATALTGSQLVWVDYTVAAGSAYAGVLAGHYVNHTFVTLVSDDLPTGAQFRVWNTQDLQGQPVAAITAWANYPTNTLHVDTYLGQTINGIASASAPVVPTVAAPVAWFVNWASPVIGDTGGLSPLAGDVIMEMLRRSSAPVDYGRFQAAAALLTAYRFDCVIDVGTKAKDWLQANIYPLLPISIVRGLEGYYPIVWRYDATAADATVQVDADIDTQITRATRMIPDAGQLANSFRLQYRYSVRTGNYTETVTRNASTCPYCAASERRYGRIESEMTTTVVYDAATAGAVLAWMARAYTSPIERISYVVPSTYHVRRGAVVLLTDSRMALAAQLCIVSDVQIDGSGMDGVEFQIIADPQRDLKTG